MGDRLSTFIVEAGDFDDRAIKALRDCTEEVQQVVLNRGSLLGVNNPSAVLMGRIRDAQTGPADVVHLPAPDPRDLVRVVRAARGERHSVTEQHQEELEDIYHFFEEARRKPGDSSASQASQARPAKTCFTLPRDLKAEWFVPFAAREGPRSGGRGGWVWQFEEDKDKLRALYQHTEALYNLGIPTFLREQPNWVQGKLLTSLEANVKDEYLPPESDESARTQFWLHLKREVVWFVVSALAKTVRGHFGPTCASNLVAVFDASGFSPASGRWKLSMRINFVERAVPNHLAKKLRLAAIDVLNEEWRSLTRGWATQLEPTQELRPGTAGNEVLPKFWEYILDDRIFDAGHQHRLVWCDVMHGDLHLPEGRPLLPYELLEVDEAAGKVNIEPIIVSTEWGFLGSSAPPETAGASAPAAPAAIAAPTRQSHQAHEPSPPCGAGLPAYQTQQQGQSYLAAPAPRRGPVHLGDSWEQWEDDSGRAYFYNRLNGGHSVRAVFVGPYFTEAGQPYYQDMASGKTEWAVPDGSVKIRPQDSRRLGR